MIRRIVPAVVVALALAVPARSGHADPWYSGHAGHRRVVHLSLFAAGGVIYLSTETFLKSSLAPSSCRWCDPTSYDVSIRNAVKWHDTSTALFLSNIDGFVVAPVAGLGLVMLASAGAPDSGWARRLDDTIPVLESAVIAGLLNQAVKFTVAEERPFVHFANPKQPHDLDDDVSFYSGHTTLAFAIATSAGMVAHERGYKLEPVVWGVGYGIATSVGYLRIAADRHYFTDVATGAVIGTGIGVAVPLLFHHGVLAEHGVSLVPTGRGAMVVGSF